MSCATTTYYSPLHAQQAAMNGCRLATRCASRGREVSPAMSDSSWLTMLSRSPSPSSSPPGRQPTPALSDSSELSMLSRSPSPPPGVLRINEISPQLNRPQHGPGDRFLRSDAKRETSPNPSARPAKQLRVVTRIPPRTVKRKAPAASSSPRSSRIPRSPVVTKAAVSILEVKGAGQLDRLPKEIRQAVYAYCLDIDEPVSLKECCGPFSTRRARASCKKHGETCTKIGRGNGLTLYEEDEGSIKIYGRFSILSVARSVHEEASWVLYNQARLIVRSTTALQAYLIKKQCTFYRLPNLPEAECVERMWLSAGHFRKLCFQLPWTKLSIDDPVECVYRLYKAIAFLMKAWDLVKEKPTSPRTVEIQLHDLHTAVIPFNSDRSTKMAYEWNAYHQPHLGSGYNADFEVIGEEVVHILERLVDLVGRHGGLSRWKVVAKAPRTYHVGGAENDGKIMYDQEDGGLTALHTLEACCRSNGVQFVATS
ncbi:uncharacterized protein CC84DRAFT_1258618 [Paraphaeosphaeria sporulosa]|uniref:Uncharacterized protein n=1 Tax=Paraphaeosphaeria sporulosa TaxID=1460663 RepID=A0A177CKR5_9PLEO|nr:uncharacterized protein CC84DRAFT_1258618 [Paraphaeosphaeria sporulosa]OAG07552.1 hypothetical protein CC84DRAFT_1258618 [Paraphaeosphaeria sporulosa]